MVQGSAGRAGHVNRRALFVVYQPKTILNKSKRPDHWFWARYSAYPYIGCQHGCEFCYCRERKYSPYDDVDDFAYIIKVKENAPSLLRRALSRAAVDVVFTGDYQPAERKFQLSRRMLEVCHDLGFPVLVLTRSPLVLRDLDLLAAIHQRARALVAFSIISTPQSPAYERVCRMEGLAPASEKRFAAMAELAKAGIPTGTCFMPVLPGLCDDDANLSSVVRWTAERGGRFVLAGGLTLADQQRAFFMAGLRSRFPDLVGLYESIYPEGAYGPTASRWKPIASRIRELCNLHGIRDRMPRPIIPGNRRALNKQVVEELADRTYTMELNGEPGYRIWSYRKAAWAIDDLEQDIGLVYREMGARGLQSIQNVGPLVARVVERMLKERMRPDVPKGSPDQPG